MGPATAAASCHSLAVDWQGLGADLVRAIAGLEALGGRVTPGAILLTVSTDYRAIDLCWADESGQPLFAAPPGIRLQIGPLPLETDAPRSGIGWAEPSKPPHPTIDRAVSSAAAAMLSWTRHPESHELVEHQRHRLFLRWATGAPEPVYEYAYGMWDE